MELGEKYERGTRCAIANVRPERSTYRQRRLADTQRTLRAVLANNHLISFASCACSYCSIPNKCRLKHTFCISLCSPTPRFGDFINVMVIRNQEKELPLLRHCRPLVPIRHIRRVREIVMIYGRGVVGVVGAVSSARGADVGTVNLRPVRDHILVDHATEKRVAT